MSHADLFRKFCVDRCAFLLLLYYYISLFFISKNFFFTKKNIHKLGATFGTGITAIKLTALGRPQLLVSFEQYKIRGFVKLNFYLSQTS